MQKKVIASPLAPKAVGPYSQAIAAGTTLYVSGQLPIDAATGLMAEGIEAQTQRALDHTEDQHLGQHQRMKCS